MSTATEPKENQILDRIVTVLAAIAEGATYWYTPARVQKRYVHWAEYTGEYPLYMVSLGSGGERGLTHSNKRIDVWTPISIKGYVQDNEDTAEKILRCYQDIRVALTAEMENGDAAALPSLGVKQCRIRDFPETDDGYLAHENSRGFFDLRIEIQTTDTLGYI